MGLLLILIPLAAVLVLNLPAKRFANRVAFWFGILFCLFQAGLVLALPAQRWNVPQDWAFRLLRTSIVADNLSFVMFLSIGIVGFASLMTARSTIVDEDRLFIFSNLVLLTLAGMNGVVVAGDLFSLYVFLEVAAVASFILIAFDRKRDAFEGAFKYLVLSAAATAMILAALGLFFAVAGSVSFSTLATLLTGRWQDPLVMTAVVLLVSGLFIKSGLVPFHGWLPDAYSAAPAPTSVLLAGIVTKTTGVYTLVRLSMLMSLASGSVQMLLLMAGLVSILVGALAALGQRDMKRMLAYSSISQVGYIILGIGIGTPLALAGAVFHLFNHSIFKSLLFVNAAAVEKQTGTTDMEKLGGLSNRMPVTGTTSVVAFLSTAGLPPFSGFWSKLIIVVAAWKAGFPLYAIAAILASLITLAYFLSMQRKVFFGKLAAGFEGLKEADPWILVPSCILAAITIGCGVFIPWLFNTFLIPVKSIL